MVRFVVLLAAAAAISAAAPARGPSYNRLVECWTANYQTRLAIIMGGGAIPADQEWAAELQAKARNAAKREGISAARIEADLKRGMDPDAAPFMDGTAYEACKRQLGYHLNRKRG